MHVMVTGAAGFIGSHLCRKLLDRGDTVTGVDSLSDYYDVNLKKDRLKRLEGDAGFSFKLLDISDRPAVKALFEDNSFDAAVNLAAQAGVRYSIDNPQSYIDTNLVGFANILEGCRHSGVKHLVYASSSSVYGANTKQPFSEHHNVDHPVSLYAASKKANELMAHSYAHLYGLPCTGLRFFTVYGPWGRPDMALFKFTRAIINGEPIQVFNHGKMVRDFTYIDDIVEGTARVIQKMPEPNMDWDSDEPDPASSSAPYRVCNIGNGRPVQLMRYIEVLEECLGIEAKKEYLPMQDGDVPSTMADVDWLDSVVGYRPEITVEVGVKNFVDWYRSYYSE